MPTSLLFLSLALACRAYNNLLSFIILPLSRREHNSIPPSYYFELAI